MLESDPGTNQY